MKVKMYNIIYTWRGERYVDLSGPHSLRRAKEVLAMYRADGWKNSWLEELN